MNANQTIKSFPGDFAARYSVAVQCNAFYVLIMLLLFYVNVFSSHLRNVSYHAEFNV